MRTMFLAGGMVGLVGAALPALGQTPPLPPTPSASTMPELATVKVQEVEVRSGGSMQFYPTGKLQYGDRVQVINETKDGWLAIKPPRGSFSWINGKFVTEPKTQGLAMVLANETPVLAGSSLSKEMPNVTMASVPQGTILDIVGLPNRTSDNNIWVMISPTPSEVRYIPASSVQRNTTSIQAASSPLTNPPSGTLTSSQVDARRKYYQWLYETEKDPSKKQFFADELRSLSQNSNIQQTSGTPRTPNNLGPATPPNTAMLNGQSPGNSDWSPYGILRQTAVKKDGLPMYALVDRKTGQHLLYVTTQPGMSLDGYLNRQVTLYGPTSYYSESRSNLMTATHVAAMPN